MIPSSVLRLSGFRKTSSRRKCLSAFPEESTLAGPKTLERGAFSVPPSSNLPASASQSNRRRRAPPASISRRMNVDFPVAIPPVTIRVFMGGRESKALLGYKERVKGLPFHPLQYGRYARSLHGRQQAFGGGKGVFRSGRSGKGIAAYGLARSVNDLSRYERSSDSS